MNKPIILSVAVPALICVQTYTAVNAAPPSTQPYSITGPIAKLAPYSDIKWDGDSPQILVDGKWFDWISINGQSLPDLVRDARRLEHEQWQKRIDEDLVELLTRIGHPVGSTVKLEVRPVGNAGPIQILEKVSMTKENRRSVHQHRQERGES